MLAINEIEASVAIGAESDVISDIAWQPLENMPQAVAVAPGPKTFDPGFRMWHRIVIICRLHGTILCCFERALTIGRI
jgi:hypothetical protein